MDLNDLVRNKEDPYREIREFFCRVFCGSHHPKPRATVTISGAGLVAVTFGENDMATVRNDGGPLKFDISGFVSDKGNPVTDKDIPALSSSDESVATVAPDPADPDGQDGVITLTGKNTDPETTVVIKASFPAQKYGQAFEVTGNLVVIDPAAAGAQAVISGPGVVDGA